MDFSPADSSGRVDQADNGASGEGFSGAGFADYSEHFALGDVEGYLVDREQRIVPGDKLHTEIADGENGFGHAVKRIGFDRPLIAVSD